MLSSLDLARTPRRAPLTARKKGSGYENEERAASAEALGTRLMIYGKLFILVPRALLTRGATRGSGQIHIPNWHLIG